MQRKKTNRKKVLVAISGGMDPLHIGHVRLIKAAQKLGDELIIILNNDNWLKDKKGFVFMPQRERKKIRPHIFANGGDRKPDGDPVPEVALCEKLGIEIIYNVGEGGKVQSSSWLLAKVAQANRKS